MNHEAASLSTKYQRAPLQGKLVTATSVPITSLSSFLSPLPFFVRFIELCPTDNSQLRVGPLSLDLLKSLAKALPAIIGPSTTSWRYPMVSTKCVITPTCPPQSVPMGNGSQQPCQASCLFFISLLPFLSFPFFPHNTSLSFISFSFSLGSSRDFYLLVFKSV